MAMRWLLGVVVGMLVGAAGSAAAQEPVRVFAEFLAWPLRVDLCEASQAKPRMVEASAEPESLTVSPRSPTDFADLLRKELPPLDPASSRTPRLQFFRMPSGVIATPLGLVPDDDPPPEDGQAVDDDLNFIQFVYGTQVPYFDMFRKGDPGGFGFYKVHSQVQVLDQGTTNVSAVVQAVTPMGLQNGGVGNGPTIISPSLACFQDLGDGTAFHAYVGQQLCANSRIRDQVRSNYRCGLAVQQPLLQGASEQGLYVYVQALAEPRSTDPTRPDSKTTSWDVIPGMQYRVNNACWMSLGVSRYSFLSCMWQY